jgi:gamma-glutamyltranspeptidase/glutathione hydrolase
MPSLTLALALVLQTAASARSVPPSTGARGPVYSADGRLAVAIHGDLWMRAPGGSWTQLTSGVEWDREPAWSPDGGSLYFASNRAGGFDLWVLRVGSRGADGEPRRLTSDPDDESSPAPLADGRVAFVRGRRGNARVYTLAADGSTARLTKSEVAQRWPTASRDGQRLAWVESSENGSRIRWRAIGASGDSTIVVDAAAEHPAWSPTGDRLSYTIAGARGGGVYVTPIDGRYTNLVSARVAESAWSPDGKSLTLAEVDDSNVGYNGDPDRVGDRDDNTLAAGGALWTIDAPEPVDAGLARQAGAPVDRAAFNAQAFDELWERQARLYYSGADAAPRRARWETLRAKYRPRALAAPDDSTLRAVLHEMLREHPPYRQAATGRAAVSSAHPVATAAGVEILARGGNVVDAAVAVSFALGVVEPDASGVGGYGQMLVYEKGFADPRLIEFMTRVPEKGGLDNSSLLVNGRLPGEGPVLANVPGTVAAMHLAWSRWGSGKVAWADLLAPAIRAARDGFVVSDGLATTLATEREHFMKYEGSRKLFFRNGEPLRAGDTLKNPDLAWTLEQIAKGGADAFYKGEIAHRIVDDLSAKGNAMQLSDLARYYAADREPVSGTYRGYTLFSSAPPVSGGASLVATLNLLEQVPSPKPYPDDAATLHAMISAWQLVPSSRGRIADPGLWPTDVQPFTSKDTARARWRCFDPSHALSPSALFAGEMKCGEGTKAASRVGLTRPPACEAHGYDADSTSHCHAAGTTAFVVADADGNVVAVTQTLGTWGGSFYVTPGLGFVYNDKLASYGTNPDAYGARLPFARHGSTIAPTIVFQGTGAQRRPAMALGAAGNAWITSAVYQVLEGMVDQRLDPQAALELPRFLIGGRGGRGGGASVQLEDGFSPAVMARLDSLGYETRVISLMGELRMGYGAAIRIENGRVTAGADPRRSGAAGAVP